MASGPIFGVRASVFWFNGATGTTGFLSTPGTDPVLDAAANTYNDEWVVNTGNGAVQVGVPVLQAFTPTQFCFAEIPAGAIRVSNVPETSVALPAQELNFQVGDDLVLIIDSTGSMGDDIENVKKETNKIVDEVARTSKSYRVAIVHYNDPDAGVVLPFSSSTTAIKAAISGLTATGGGDFPEHVYSGINTALLLPWRSGAARISITMGDAPPKDPEPGTGLTQAKIEELANAIAVIVNTDPILPGRFLHVLRQGGPKKTLRVPYKGLNPLSMVPIGRSAATNASFTKLAEGTGGAVFPAATAAGVSTAIIKAIKTATKPLIPVQKLVVSSYCWRVFTSHRITISNVNTINVPFTWTAVAFGRTTTGKGVAIKSSTTTVDISFPRLGKYIVKVSWKDERGIAQSASVDTGRLCYCLAFISNRICVS